MTRNRQGQYPPPPEGVTERRRGTAGRRETDDENQEIVSHAVEEAPLVHSLLRTSKVAASIGVLCAFVGAGGTAIGMSVRGPKQEIADVDVRTNKRIDTNAIKITVLRHEFDSVVVELREMKRDIRTIANLSCINARSVSKNVAAAGGCDDRDPKP